MGNATFRDDFESDIEFIRVKDRADAYLIHLRTEPGNCSPIASEMTEKDWDKFEKDIADAFEQIP